MVLSAETIQVLNSSLTRRVSNRTEVASVQREPGLRSARVRVHVRGEGTYTADSSAQLSEQPYLRFQGGFQSQSSHSV